MKIKVIHKHMAASGALDFEYAPGYFFTRNAACDDYDWLVVYDEMCELNVGTIRDGVESLRCDPRHTILATWEPVSIKCYSRAYTRQFAHLLTNRPYRAEKHPGYFLGRGYFDWFVDRNYMQARDAKIPAKTKDISVVCSEKKMKGATRHSDRFNLVTALSQGVPEMDWYGHGVKGFGKKYEVLDPYRYHVAIENHIAPHHWTEKLSDAFLCECLPFYAGAPDLADDFPADSFIPIPIDDPQEAVKIVKAAIANGEYEKRREAVLEAKRLILTKYNFWAQVIAVIEQDRVSTDYTDFHRLCTCAKIVDRKKLRKTRLSAALEEGFFHLRQYLHLTPKC